MINNHSNKKYKYFDNLVLTAGLLGSIFTIPQAFLIFKEQTADGVSLISWISYTALALIWSVYGVLHKDKQIFVTNVFGFLINLTVTIGILLF